MESLSPLNFTRKFFGDAAAEVNDLSLISSFAQKRGISSDTPVQTIIAQLEEESLGKLRQANTTSNIKATRQLFGESALGIDDNTLALSFAKSQGLSADTPISEVFDLMESESRNRLGEQDISRFQDRVPLNQLPQAVDFLREQDTDKRSGFNFQNPNEELDLEGVSDFLRPESTKKNIFERIGQEVLSLDFFAQEVGRAVGKGLGADERQQRFNEIDARLNDPDTIASFLSKVERFQENPELFSDDERQKLFQAAKLYETTNAFFDVEKSGVGQFLTSANKATIQPLAKGINQILGTTFNAAGIDREFTDSILRDLNFTDEQLAQTDPESAAAIAGQITGSIAQTVVSIMTGIGPVGMFALYGTQGAGGNIETYRQIARQEGFDPEVGTEAIVGLGGMIISGGLGAALTGKTVGSLPFVKSFQEGGERALFESANRSGILNGVTRETLFQTGLAGLTNGMKTIGRNTSQAAKSYLQFAASTGTVEAIEEVSEEALNELLLNASIEQFETDPEEFMKNLGFSALGGLVGGAAIGPAVRSRVRKETKNTSKNLLGLADIAPDSVEEARANLETLNAREQALKDRFDGQLPGIIATDIAETRNKLQAVANGVADPTEVFTRRSDPLLRFTTPLGDIAADARLAGTGFQENAQASLSKDTQDVSKNQLEAFTELADRLEQSDLPPEVVGQILGRTRITRMGSTAGRRNAVTLHDVDEQGNKSLHRVIFTNDSDKKSAVDELFHIVVDSAPQQIQQGIVDGFNQTYNARAVDYNSEKTRDRIASKVASIVTGEEDLPDVDNEFTRAVRDIQNGEFTNINLDLAGGLRQNVQGPTQAVAIDEMNEGLNDGRYRMVDAPGHEGKTTFQDETGTVFQYFTTEDSEGNVTGHVEALGSFDKLPTIGVPASRAVAPFVGNQVVPGGGTEENFNQERREAFERLRDERSRPVAPQNALVVQDPEQRFGTNTDAGSENNNELRKEIFLETRERLRKRNLIQPQQETSPGQQTVRLLTEGNPQNRLDVLTNNLQRRAEENDDIPLGLLQEIIDTQNEVAGLLPPAQTQGVVTESGPLQTATRDNPDPFNPNVNTGPVTPGQELSTNVNETGVALGPESLSQERLQELASEVIRILEARGEPIPQALLDIITVDAEVQDVEPGTAALPSAERGQLPPSSQRLLPATTGPTNYAEFLAATDTEPSEFARQTIERVSAEQVRRNQVRLLPQNAGSSNVPPVDGQEEAPAVQTSEPNPVLAELDPQIANQLPQELVPAVESLLTGIESEGMTPVGQTDFNSGFPLMETTEELSDQLAASGVAITGTIQIGDTGPVETVPTVISINPEALREVSDAINAQPEQDAEQVLDAQATFNEQFETDEQVAYYELADEVGEVQRFATPQSARNAVETQFEAESESNPGSGSTDIISVGSREFTLDRRSESLADVVERGLGDRVAQVGAILQELPDGPPKTRLLKATRSAINTLKRQAQGSSRFNQSTLDTRLERLDTAIREVNPGVDLTPFTGVVGTEGTADGDTQEGVSEVQAALEAASQTEQEVPVDLTDSDVRKKVRRMRGRIKRSRFNRIDNTGLAEFRTNTEKNANAFIQKAEELGATQVDLRKVEGEGKAEYVAEVQFHPQVANDIFQDQTEAASADLITQFANPTPVDPESSTVNNNTVTQPFYSKSIPGRIRVAVGDAVKGLKIRANLHVTSFEDVKGQFFSGSGFHQDMFDAVQGDITTIELNGLETKGVALSRYNNGRLNVIIALRDDMNLESDEALEILSHELGHVISKDILNREEHDTAYEQLTQEHNKFVEENQDISVAQFTQEQRLPSLFATMVNGEDARNITMRQLRNDPQMRQMYEYITSFEEWFADQTARWMTTGVTHSVTKEQEGLFKAIGKRFKSLFDRFKNRNAYPPNKTFENWINDYVNSLQETQVNFATPARGDKQQGRSIVTEDSMNLEYAVSTMTPNEVEARKTNQFEASVNGEIANLRDEIPNWNTLEQAVRAGRSAAATMPTQELVEKARHYEKLYSASIALANRPAPQNVPIDVLASYSTSAGIFPERWSQRMDDWYQAYRESTFNQIRRQLLSPVITRMQIVAGNHPELQSIGNLIDKTFASAGRRSGEVPFVDRVQQEIVQRTDRIGRVIDPIFQAFGYTNTGIQKAAVGLFKGGNLNDVVRQVYMGVRNKEWLTPEQLNQEYNGVRMETIIDQMRVEMDSLRDYAVSKGLLSEDEFITYEDNGVEHYVPRVYDQETVRSNFEHFKVHVIEANLRDAYLKDAYIDFLQENDPGRIANMSEEQLDNIVVPDTFKLEAEDEQNIVSIAENIAANIAFGRTATFAKQFTPDAFSGHENFASIIDKFGTRVPDRMKRRKLFFVKDEQLLGRPGFEADGRSINYLDTNIINVMGRSIEQIVKRGEYKDIYNNGQAFGTAWQELKDKKRAAELRGDGRAAKAIQYDIEALEGLYESVAEVVDLEGHKSIQNGPLRDLLSSFARTATVSVMGLSTILAVVELGNIPLRIGVVPGMKNVIGKSLEVGFKKVINWPGAAIGKGKNYTDKLEDELTIMGYLHTVGEDFSARVRTDNPFDNQARGATALNVTEDVQGNSLGETAAKVARNMTSGLEFMEDVFYRVTLLESMTRLSQTVAAHAAKDLMTDIMDTSDAGNLTSAQNRELKRLGFVDADGNLDMEQFNEYKSFYRGLQTARRGGSDQIQAYADANSEMFQGTHFRVTTRLINQMIARPNVVTRPRWGNSKHPLKRMMYRLRSFTHGYRELAARFYTDEFKNVAAEEGGWGIARMLARFLPLLFMAGMSIVARAEISAFVHDAAGNSSQAERIRTLQRDKDPIDFMVEAFDKTGMTLQGSEVIGGVTGLKYGSSIFSVVGGVTASKLEKLAETSIQTYVSGDPAFLWNNMVDFAPGANTGVWDGMKLDLQKSEKQIKSDADFYGMLNGSQANWW